MTKSGLNLGGSPTMKNDTLTRTTPSPSLSVSVEEAQNYYHGLPSKPLLVARTSRTPWEMPTGEYASYRRKELRIVGRHEIEEVWEDKLALEVHHILDVKKVDWTSTDVVRIGYADESSGNVILWIGVHPMSLSYELGIIVAQQSKELMLSLGIDDVDVEIRESKLIRLLAEPQLLEPVLDSDPTAIVREPFAYSLGIPICSRSTPWAEGTGGFFVQDGGKHKRILLVTVRHVPLPESNNAPFEPPLPNEPCHDILIHSDMSYHQSLDLVDEKIEAWDTMIKVYTDRGNGVKGVEGRAALREREEVAGLLKKSVDNRKDVVAFYEELWTRWATDDSRVLGHLIYSPPIAVGVGPEQFTQDMAVIEIDPAKIDSSNFMGNIIDLGDKYSPSALEKKMDGKNPRNFNWPGDRLLRLRGIIEVNEMRKPTTSDKNDDPCIMVLKNGRSSGLTVGRANNIMSYSRSPSHDVSGVSKEWAILPYDTKSGPFSVKGDSGSVVADGTGRIGGIITAGSGLTDSTDVTYATPIRFILETIRSYGPLAEVSLIEPRPRLPSPSQSETALAPSSSSMAQDGSAVSSLPLAALSLS